MDTEALFDTEQKHRGIPAAKFLEDVSALSWDEVDDMSKKHVILYEKYKFMEQQLQQQRKAHLQKAPDIKNALDAVQHLLAATDTIETRFELANSVYAKAQISDAQTVFLWLGADVMLEYELDEAAELLDKNLKAAKEQIASYEDDLLYLKDQITVMEVNIARLHNKQVALKKQQQELEKNKNNN